MQNLLWLALVMWAISPPPVFAQDPVKVDPAHHKVELENADVRVLRITFEPGDKAAAHDHPNSVAVFLSDGLNRLTTDGKPTDTPQKPGDVVLLNASKHTVENIGKNRTEVILVELKKPGSKTSKGMALDPVKVNPKNYVVVAENEHARAIRLRSAVGDASVVQEHPSNVVVRLNDSATAKAGSVTWAPGPEKHGGTAPTSASANEVIIVEVKSGSGAGASPQ